MHVRCRAASSFSSVSIRSSGLVSRGSDANDTEAKRWSEETDLHPAAALLLQRAQGRGAATPGVPPGRSPGPQLILRRRPDAGAGPCRSRGGRTQTSSNISLFDLGRARGRRTDAAAAGKVED